MATIAKDWRDDAMSDKKWVYLTTTSDLSKRWAYVAIQHQVVRRK